MALSQPVDFYHRYRFAVVIEAGESQWELGLTRVEQDPFTGDVFLYRGLSPKLPLVDLVPDEGTLQVYLLARRNFGSEPPSGKRLTLTYGSVRRLPLLLDATTGEVALERVVLEDVTYQKSQEVTRIELPSVVLTQNS